MPVPPGPREGGEYTGGQADAGGFVQREHSGAASGGHHMGGSGCGGTGVPLVPGNI